ncbi:MAG: shikimate dehydrogenase [Kiritimatiellia bacterium]
MRISGKTKPYAVLGHPIGHTLSPVMHMAAFEALGMDAVYLALDVAPDKLMQVLPAMQAMGFGGANLTVPLKEIAFRGLKHLDETAKQAGAVNTVAFKDENISGFNTDGEGLLRALREAFGTGAEGLSVFVLGTGGAGRAAALSCARDGAKAVTLFDLDRARSERVAGEIRTAAGGISVSVLNESPEAGAQAADLIIQATPVGMKPGEAAPLKPDAFRKGQFVYDLIYMYPETLLLMAARKAGAKTANGLGMLLHQGAAAFEIWTGVKPPVDVMRKALENEVYHA